jgi:hypothetical protein
MNMPKSTEQLNSSASKLRRGPAVRSKHVANAQVTSGVEVATVHSDAAIETLLGDGKYLVNGKESLNFVAEERSFTGDLLSVDELGATYGEGTSSGTKAHAATRFLKRCAGADIDAARERLLPYVVPQSFRIEVLADMKRVASDCRRNFSLAASPVDAIFQTLREVCPDATAAELRAVLTAAEVELHAKIARLGGWSFDALGVTDEIETWLELAKGRIHDLSCARTSVK